MTEHELEGKELRTLLDLYMEEARGFSAALERGASWEELKRLRARIKLVGTCISRKYDSQSLPAERRRDYGSPAGD